MLWFRRSDERRHAVRGHEVWHTFDAHDRSDPLAHGFGALEILAEDRFRPGACVIHRARRDGDVVTYVRRGVLLLAGSRGPPTLLLAGEFHRISAQAGARLTAMNPSGSDSAHAFQFWLRPSGSAFEEGFEQSRFSIAQRRGRLFPIASPDGRDGSLRLHQDTVVYSTLLLPGRHVVHELMTGRSGWLHVVAGTMTLGEELLGAGDGVGISEGSPVSFRTRSHVEVLLFDLAGTLPRLPADTATGADPRGRASSDPTEDREP